MNNKAEQSQENGWYAYRDMKEYGPSSRHTRELIFAELDSIAFSSLIDIGCGDGTFLVEALKRYDVDIVYGTDVREDAVSMAAARVPGTVFQSDIAQTTITPPDEIDGQFDVAVCSEVLEHIKDDRAALRTIRELADWAVFTVPAGEYGADDTEAGHHRRYSRTEFQRKVEEAGFEVVSIRNWGFPLYSPLYRKALQHTSDGTRSGEYGSPKKLTAEMIYQAFKLNVFDRGDRIVARVR